MHLALRCRAVIRQRVIDGGPLLLKVTRCCHFRRCINQVRVEEENKDTLFDLVQTQMSFFFVLFIDLLSVTTSTRDLSLSRPIVAETIIG